MNLDPNNFNMQGSPPPKSNGQFGDETNFYKSFNEQQQKQKGKTHEKSGINLKKTYIKAIE